MKLDSEFEKLMKENAENPNSMLSRIEHEPGSIYFSTLQKPEDWPDVKSTNLRFAWLARFVAWFLNKLTK